MRGLKRLFAFRPLAVVKTILMDVKTKCPDFPKSEAFFIWQLPFKHPL
jgi:hypothetical protein